MSGTEPDHNHDRRVEEIVRIASEMADDDLMDLPPDEILKIVMERGRGPHEDEDGGAAITAPDPQRPSPNDSAIALPLPIEDDLD